MNGRLLLTLIIHLEVGGFYLFAEQEVGWLPHFTESWGWFALLWIPLFMAGVVLAKQYGGRGLLVPFAATALTLIAGFLFIYGGVDGYALFAPLIILLWTFWMFWPSILGAIALLLWRQGRAA